MAYPWVTVWDPTGALNGGVSAEHSTILGPAAQPQNSLLFCCVSCASLSICRLWPSCSPAVIPFMHTGRPQTLVTTTHRPVLALVIPASTSHPSGSCAGDSQPPLSLLAEHLPHQVVSTPPREEVGFGKDAFRLPRRLKPLHLVSHGATGAKTGHRQRPCGEKRLAPCTTVGVTYKQMRPMDAGEKFKTLGGRGRSSCLRAQRAAWVPCSLVPLVAVTCRAMTWTNSTDGTFSALRALTEGWKPFSSR